MSTIEEEFANLAPPENFDWDESALGNDVDLPPELRPLSPTHESENPGLSTTQEDDKAIVDKQEIDPPSEQIDSKEVETADDRSAETSSVTKNPEDDEEKRKQRALRFGIPLSDKEKAAQRAKRFGIPMSQPAQESKKKAKASDKSTKPKTEQPAEKADEIERALKRAERFGIPLSDEQKAAKRALRFGLPVAEEAAKKAPAANKQKAKQNNSKNKTSADDKKTKKTANKPTPNTKPPQQKNVQTTKPKQKNAKKPQNSPQKPKPTSAINEATLKKRQARFGTVDTSEGQIPQMKKKRTGRFNGNNKNKKAKSA
ncbi:hypothetical protein K493DRAFT_85094 [Basidiobolus meristosporus CBS 931.73]|uniref:THO1-MOS11 C-terminal domain-containing protein n=1 Tax=Basidiobolus meristosporus CBS 931.73 TaxID=1314790 RepID=A0A1Y1YXD7_9FUNG|nr:hypothetical protein K493DRAFT_85094 [Basidiobolus meristosporus CBS 931.73]|eukprot:ORY02225.1 hypothetical protein K493DRAFT_85094 [Basidiobolus meristosporus CBS 931.73]